MIKKVPKSAEALSLSHALLNKNEHQTQDNLNLFQSLLSKWSRVSNLIATQDLSNLWSRHIVNSWQIAPYLTDKSPIVDLGSGAGFPGLILGILGYQPLTLIEKNQKKCMFLQEVTMCLACNNVTVYQGKIENFVFPMHSQVIARGCAPLYQLCHMLVQQWSRIQKGVFHKGKNIYQEISIAKRFFDFQYTLYPDNSTYSGCIIEVTSLTEKIC